MARPKTSRITVPSTMTSNTARRAVSGSMPLSPVHVSTPSPVFPRPRPATSMFFFVERSVSTFIARQPDGRTHGAAIVTPES